MRILGRGPFKVRYDKSTSTEFNLKLSECKEFEDLRQRFEAMFKKDLGKPADHEGMYYVYAYTMMPNKIRKVKINGINADTLFNNCYNMFYNYGLGDLGSVRFLACPGNACDQSVGARYLSSLESYTELNKIYDLALESKVKEANVKSWVMHDLIHDLIDAPLDVVGDAFVVALSCHLELGQSTRTNLWNDYRSIIVNSRLISPRLKNNFFEYEKQISSTNKKHLLGELVGMTNEIIDGKTLNPQYIANMRSAYNLCAQKWVQDLKVTFKGYDR